MYVYRYSQVVLVTLELRLRLIQDSHCQRLPFCLTLLYRLLEARTPPVPAIAHTAPRRGSSLPNYALALLVHS